MNEQEIPPAESSPGTSTLASGPAGTHFEAQVGASYLLAMLSGAPARGLPGATIDRVALQQANAGRPLDDVVLHAHDNVSGKPAVLEVQVVFRPSLRPHHHRQTTRALQPEPEH